MRRRNHGCGAPGHRVRYRPGFAQAQRHPRLLHDAAGGLYQTRFVGSFHAGDQHGSGLPGAGRHAFQPAFPVEGSRPGGKIRRSAQQYTRVRADAGYPPLVTPSSQIVGTQAVFNVITGERYKMCTNEFKGIVRGQYGQTPVKIDPEFRKKIIGDEAPIEGRPADLLEPELDTLRAEIAEYIEQEEDVLSYAQFPQIAIKFFQARRDKKVRD